MSVIFSKQTEPTFKMPTQAEINAMSTKEYFELRRTVLRPVAELKEKLSEKEAEWGKNGGDCRNAEKIIETTSLEIKKCQEELKQLQDSLPENLRSIPYETMIKEEFRTKNSNVTGEHVVAKLKIIGVGTRDREHTKFLKIYQEMIERRDRLKNEIQELKEKTAPQDKIISTLSEMWKKRPSAEQKAQTTSQSKPNTP